MDDFFPNDVLRKARNIAGGYTNLAEAEGVILARMIASAIMDERCDRTLAAKREREALKKSLLAEIDLMRSKVVGAMTYGDGE